MKHQLKIISTSAILLSLTGCYFMNAIKEKFEYKHEEHFANLAAVKALFPLSVDAIEARVETSIAQAKKDLVALLALKAEERTFENTARALDTIGENLSVQTTPISILKMVSPDQALRDAAEKAILEVNKFSVDAFNTKELYEAFTSYLDNASHTEKLNDEQRYYLSETLKGFKRGGLDRPQKELDAINELKKEISELSIKFSSNIDKDTSTISATHDELAGLTEDFIAALKKDENGNYTLGTDYPTYYTVMGHCSVPKTREALFKAFNNRAYPDNKKLLETIIAKRDKLARLLDFNSYADLVLDSKMAKTSERAEKFVRDLISASQDKARAEIKTFLEVKPSDIVLTHDGKLQPWDVARLMENYKKEKFNIDDREIAEYFPMEKTLQGLFDIYQTFFDLHFKLEKNVGLWHEDVDVIKVYRNKDKQFLGHIFLDLYPRANKYPHACCYSFIPGLEYTNKAGRTISQPSASVVIANFTKSTAQKPSLLKHGEVTTFFHEFGHAIHAVLGRTEMPEFSGTSVKTDFVEMPSQMLEEWMWDKDMLAKVSSHYKTGKPLSQETIATMIGLKKYDGGHMVLRQNQLGLYSLLCFKEGAAKDTDKLRKDIWELYAPHIRFDESTHFQASFGHLMGYSAAYYGYMWSKVFALDVFSQIKKAGLLNQEMGQKLINDIFGRGGSADPNILLRNFLGREPNNEAFLQDFGL
jgi:thimet oligopeptidase